MFMFYCLSVAVGLCAYSVVQNVGNTKAQEAAKLSEVCLSYIVVTYEDVCLE